MEKFETAEKIMDQKAMQSEYRKEISRRRAKTRKI